LIRMPEGRVVKVLEGFPGLAAAGP
jgi:hypothetical protein